MSTVQQLPRALSGLTDKAIGLTKEFWGTVLSNDGLKESGQAQQRKGTEKIEAVQHEVKADVERAKAEGKEQQQKLYQSGGGLGNQSDSEFGKGGAKEVAGGATEKAKGVVK